MKLLHWPGIEPGPPAWQAKILPLNHQCCVLLHNFNTMHKHIICASRLKCQTTGLDASLSFLSTSCIFDIIAQSAFLLGS